jgi:FAD/FMN-containing dehydrogenase
MKVVLADGSVIKMGGRVVKNVAGYDLCKLFTGSYGTLGIIVELNFKLRPRPECERTVIVDGPLSELPAKARSIIAAGLFPVAAEIVSPAFASLLGLAANRPVMLVRFAGNEVAVKYQIERTLALSEGCDVIIDDAQVWQQIAAAPLQHSSGWYASVLPTELDALCKDIDVPDAIWQIGAADGRIRMLDDKVKNPVTDRGNARFLMDRVKQQLDPTNKFGVYR